MAREVLLAVTGGIAAYRAADLVRELRKRDYGVTVAMTESATKFVGPDTFRALTGRPVLLDNASDDSFPHLDAARLADVFLVAPATANTIARFAQGIADDVVTASYLGFAGEVLVCPSMNVRMWQHPTTQRNVEQLVADGVTIVGPDRGDLACGDEGAGRLAVIEAIADEVDRSLSRPGGPLDGATVLVTAGGTVEPIDDIRFIGNHSSGRMGVAIAREARELGATDVRLIVTASVQPSLYEGVDPVAVVSTASELEAAVHAQLDDVDMVVMAAAVSDFTVPEMSGKLERSANITLTLEPTIDILGGLGESRKVGKIGATLIGFAAEASSDGADRAAAKLERKGIDAVVFNDVSRADIGFDAQDNEVTVITRDDRVHIPKGPKSTVARAILERCATLRHEGHSAVPSRKT
jgi:phosphopantothenoylcysteine decarboxylase/phosphopantothenate--cysteine ligase